MLHHGCMDDFFCTLDTENVEIVAFVIIELEHAVVTAACELWCFSLSIVHC